MLMSPEVIRDLELIVREHYDLIGAVIFGPDAVDPKAWRKALELGLVDLNNSESIAKILQMFGAYMGTVGADPNSAQAQITLDEFRKMLREQTIARTEQEIASAKIARRTAAQYLAASGSKAAHQTVGKLHDLDAEADRTFKQTVRDVLGARYGDAEAQARIEAAGLAGGLGEDFFEDVYRGTIKQGVSDIGHLSGQWRRDLQRIVQTESHGLVQQGLQDRWEAQAADDAATFKRPVDDVRVYKIPRPGACKHCIRLHLDGEFPRIYFLSDATGNGTNVGRKAADWQFVVGSVHPWCGCPFFKVPAFVVMPDKWSSGQAAPSVIGVAGRLVVS